MKDHMEVYHYKIEVLNQEIPSSWYLDSTEPSKELAISLSELNFKRVEIEKLKKLVPVQNDEINIFKRRLKDKDKTIEQYEKVKAKLQGYVEQLHKQLVGKQYLIGEIHLI